MADDNENDETAVEDMTDEQARERLSEIATTHAAKAAAWADRASEFLLKAEAADRPGEWDHEQTKAMSAVAQAHAAAAEATIAAFHFRDEFETGIGWG